LASQYQIYSSATEAHVRKQFFQGCCYIIQEHWIGQKSNLQLLNCESNALTTTLPYNWDHSTIRETCCCCSYE